jgi:hypothetical protein
MRGSLASRPSASIAGRLYYVTDSGVERLTRDTGSTLEDFYLGYGYVTNKSHASTHSDGSSDPITGNLAATARVNLRKNTSTAVGTRRGINLIEGANITLSMADDSANERVNVTISAGTAVTTIPYGTSLPGSPSDGDEYILVDSTSGSTYRWHLRYNQNQTSPHK